MKRKFKILGVAMSLLLGANLALAQISNGGFNTSLSPWSVSSTPVTPYIVTTLPSGTSWADLTGSGWGNGGWIEQTVNSPNIVAGNFYRLRMKLGNLYVPAWALNDAGVNVYINGNPLNAGANRLFNSVFNSTTSPYMNWKTVDSDIFMATGCSVTIRIVGNGQVVTSSTLASNPSDTRGPGVIGLDDVELVPMADQYTVTTTQQEDCNKYCFNVFSVPVLGAPDPLTISWYVNNVLESNGNQFCRTMPKGLARQVKTIITLPGGCPPNSIITKTVITNILAQQDCPCNLEGHVALNYNFTSCNSAAFNLTLDPGYKLQYTQWTIDGASVSGTTTSLNLSNLAPGQHTICAMLMGGVEGEIDNLCCSKICKVITVPPPPVSIVKTVTYCPLTHPQGPLYNPCIDCNGFYEYLENGQIVSTSNSGCGPFNLKPSSKVQCYQVLQGGYKCLVKTITFNVQGLGLAYSLPDETVYIPCNSSVNSVTYAITCSGTYEIYGPNGFYLQGISPSFVSLPPGDYNVICNDHVSCNIYGKTVHVIEKLMIMAALPDDYLIIPCASTAIGYNPGCNGNYEITGPNGYYFQGNGQFPTLATLVAGSYTVLCVDLENCITYGKVVNVSDPVYAHSTCGATIEACQFNFDPNQPYYFLNEMTCDECKSIIQNSTSAGSWITTGYTINGLMGPVRLVTREYVDDINCRKCTVTFTIANAQPYVYTMQPDQPCKEFTVPDCMKNTTVKMFINGHPEDVTDYQINGNTVTLCCNNIYNTNNPQYVFYSETDPCCWFIVDLDCNQIEGAKPKDEHSTPQSGNVSNLKLVPNPTSSVFRIVSDKDYVRYNSMEIKNMDGKVMMRKTNLDSNTEIDASKLAKGTYTIYIVSDAGLISLKLILMSE